MAENIKIMLSSTITDMLADRDAIIRLFERYPFVELIGANPIQKSYPTSPYTNTLDMAKSCDFYFLMLGSRYGYEIRPNISPTEAEFDHAYQANPTKILVFKNISNPPEPKQETFIKKVGNYFKGYWISEYTYTHDLQNLVEDPLLQKYYKLVFIIQELRLLKM